MDLFKRAIAKAKGKLAKQIKITKETDDKVFYEVEGFTGWYNKDEGGPKMSLNQADKEWITKAIVIGVREGIKPLSEKIDALDTRLTSLETKVDAVDTRLTSLETKVDALDTKLDKHIKEGH